QQVTRPGRMRADPDVLVDLALDQRRARFGRGVRLAVQYSPACASAEARAPEGRGDRGVVSGVGEEMRRHPVGLDFDLAVELLVAAELAEESLLDTRARQSPTVLEHEVLQLVREHDRQFVVGRGGRET